MVKILHCADMHLDSPFSLETPKNAQKRKNELLLAFVNMMMYAKDNGVSLILLPGDLFDSDEPSEDTYEMVKREFANAHDIKIVIAPGNHDPFTKESVWAKGGFSENVFVFSKNSLSRFDFDFGDLGVSVFGYAFTSPKMTRFPFNMSEVQNIDRSRINILCAHADLTRTSSDYAPLSPSDLEEAPFDYIALGHIHERTDPIKAGNCYYSYCGCLEGRDFGETGEKGATVAILDKSKSTGKGKGEGEGDQSGTFLLRSAFVRFSRMRYEIKTLDVTGMKTNEEMEDRFERIIRENEYGSDTLLRLIISGQSASALHISRGVFEAKAKGIYYIEIIDRTIPALDYALLEEDKTIRGALFEELRDDLFSGDENKKALAERALRIALSALSDSDFSEL